MENHSKVLVKVHNGKGWVWRHFCYVPTELLNKYKKTGVELSDKILSWANLDTGIGIADLDSLKAAKDRIRALYKQKYPDLYMENEIDKQGWNRLWVIEHIREELKNEQNTIHNSN